ncbi:exodeoxyribonuclease III [Aldersonia sp. NBC_00410]|uniref:exodeoxyribonuclease III n=1 Tax=Aldersonia sp. NBC_00410 TaxID=2975954 RepID=UPI00224F4E30|nr:exodeoxyribonuclease III [Aldersonia sp. NBC_00410]MCX5044454.1 exodeoxyribonuclease III [Aldersonia sp. NBC_00410]
MPLIVSTVNVNGIRAAARKGLLGWLDSTTADVVALQETRATEEQAQAALAPAVARGWHLVGAEPEAKGRSGVAILSRQRPEAVRVGFGDGEFAASCRYLEADFGPVAVASVYVPSGDVGTERQDAKYRFMDAFAAHLTARVAQLQAVGRELLVCGDWNIAHAEADIAAWKSNLKSSGFLPDERAWLDGLIGPGAVLVDVVRRLYPDVAGPYSWWSYRGRAFDNDAGWRIDYHMATPGLAERAKQATVERAPAYDQRWSDHAPVTVQYR